MENTDERLAEFFSKDKPFSEAFKYLFENASDAIYILDKNGNFAAVNRKAEELTGFKREDFVGKSFRKIIPLKSLPEAIKGFLDVVRGKEVKIELELKTATKKTVLAEVTSTPLIVKGKIVGTLGIVRDITERKKAENALRESEEKFRKIFESANDSLIYLDTSGRIVDVNEKAVETFGGSKEELLGKNFIRVGIFSLRDIPKLLSLFARILRGKEGYIRLRIKNKKDQEVCLECSSSIIKANNKLFGILVIARDITERKEMEEKWCSLVENAPNIILIVDRDGKIQFINRTVINTSPEEVIGRSIYDFIDPKHHDVVRKTIGQVFQSGEGSSYEISGTGPDGGASWYATQVGPIKRDGQIVSVTLITIDVTERKQMQQKLEEYSQQLEVLVEKRTRQLKEAQEQLIKSERLATIGQVAAMVGHDLRNPLTGINGAAYYLKTKLGQKLDMKSKEMFEIIERDVRHANKIINDLMEYSREIRLEFTETTPKSIMNDALSLVEIPKNLQIEDLTQNEPKMKMDIDKMKRVFSNFIKNAVDAMSEGGKLAISSRKSDGNVEIMFVDTGMGMAKEVMEKLWTPFFTTKAKGMGLGLAICKRIIENHGGKISVESIVGEGTTFTVTIPIEPKPKEERGGEKTWVNVPESLLSTTTKA